MAKPLYLAFFFLGAVLLYSIGNWSLPLIDRDEPRFAEASREMRQSGDLLVPRLNGDYRFDKPPLIYWCQVLSYDVLGENDFAARFPSTVFAGLTAVATLLFASRIFGPRVGLWSGIIFATSLQVFIHARAAVADMPLVFFFLDRHLGRLGTVKAIRNLASGGGRSISLSVLGSSPKGRLLCSPFSSLPGNRFSTAPLSNSNSDPLCLADWWSWRSSGFGVFPH